MISTDLFEQGSHWRVECLKVDGVTPATAFFAAIAADTGTRDADALPGLLYAINMRANLPLGATMSESRFKQVRGQGGLMEFKSDQLRLFACFGGKGKIILLNGLRGKKQTQARDAERTAIATAVKLMDQAATLRVAESPPIKKGKHRR